MNFPLQNIEAHLDETSLLLGEQLLEEGRVRDLRELERHFWVAQVQETGVFEVEIKVTPSKVKATTCECNRFHESGKCEHIAAVLLKLRQQLIKPEPPEEPSNKEIEEDSPRRLTTGVVLEQVDHDELVTFVKQYAKTNRNFALALKARFAPNVSSIDSREKYLQLLESTISAARRPDRTFTQRGANSIYKVLLEIQSQIDDAIAQGYLAEAVVMAQSIIEKITPLLRKMQAMQEEIREQIREAFDVLHQVLELSPPPALKESIWEYSLRECRKLLYRNAEIDQFFFKLLIRMAEESVHAEQLLELLDEQIHRYFFEKRELARLLLAKLTLLEKLDRVEEAQDFINRHIANDEVLLFAIRQSMNKGNIKRAKNLAKSGLENSVSKETKALLEETLLKIAQLEKDTDAVQLYGRIRLLETLDFEYVELLKENTEGNWSGLFQALLASIRELPFSVEKQRLIAVMLYEEGLYSDLLAYLRETQSLDLASEFAHLLLPYERLKVSQFYQELFELYLSNHIGRKPSAKIRTIIRTLFENNEEELVETLVENLRNNFPERHTLMEELELF